MLPPDTYVQPNAPDPVLDSDTVLRIVRKHVPGAASVTAVDETGGEARAYMVDADVVLKTQRPQQRRERTSLEKEAFFLDALRDVPGVSVPRVLGYGRDTDIEYICMSRMPGIAARTVTLEGDARTRFLQDLGAMLHRIHAVPQQQFYAHARFPGPRTAEQFVERLRTGLTRAVEEIERYPQVWSLEESARSCADGVFARLVPGTPVDLVAVHSNPGPEHVFVDPATLTLSGIIDFGDAYITHPAFDMRWPRPRDREAVFAGYTQGWAPSEDFLAAWRASTILAEMTAIAFRPDRRESATAVLRWAARSAPLP